MPFMAPARTAFAALGIDPADERLYRLVLPLNGRSVEECATALEGTVRELHGRLARLLELGAVEIEQGVLRVQPPVRILVERVAAQGEALRASATKLDQLRDALPALRDVLADPSPGGALAGGELLVGGDAAGLLEHWIRNSTGDLMWLRPDQWRMPSESPMRSAVAEAIRSGRRCRAIYPARALEEAPTVLLERMAVGEEVRIVAEVPSRMAVVGDAGVLLPEVWGENNERRLRVRQPALQVALAELFEQLWDRAISIGGPAAAANPGVLTAEQSRRLLLEQLASGSKDEQIARVLGVSLRTIRRRVAHLLHDLGVGSRFQAGVEAVRRGLI